MRVSKASDGQFFPSPKFLRKSERQLKRLQRIVSKRKKGSNRRKKSVMLLAKKHEYISNLRKNNAHQASRQLVNQYDVIAFEDFENQENRIIIIKCFGLGTSLRGEDGNSRLNETRSSSINW